MNIYTRELIKLNDYLLLANNDNSKLIELEKVLFFYDRRINKLERNYILNTAVAFKDINKTKLEQEINYLDNKQARATEYRKQMLKRLFRNY